MKIVTDNFDSITALYAHLATTGTGAGPCGNASMKPPSPSWDLGTSYAQATEMARRGGYWPEGAAELQSVDISDAAQSMAMGITPVIVADVVGGAVDVGEYLQGGPECFLRVEDEPGHIRPIVRIGVCVIASANVTALAMMSRGRAILALVDALELQGYSVELTAMYVAQDKQIQTTYFCNTILKQAGAHWDASSVAFGLAHPAFARRLGFRACEFNTAAQRITNGGYGNGNIESPPGYELYFGYLTNNANDTPELALKSVTAELAKQAPDLMA